MAVHRLIWTVTVRSSTVCPRIRNGQADALIFVVVMITLFVIGGMLVYMGSIRQMGKCLDVAHTLNREDQEEDVNVEKCLLHRPR